MRFFSIVTILWVSQCDERKTINCVTSTVLNSNNQQFCFSWLFKRKVSIVTNLKYFLKFVKGDCQLRKELKLGFLRKDLLEILCLKVF